ncbi:TPA: helix-turn-helix domain-containing protein [Neisseria lactamica]
MYRGMTQSEVAAKAGISQAALSQIEKQGSCPQTQTREQFAKIYSCHPNQLIG